MTLYNEKFSGYQPGTDQYPEDEDRDGPWNIGFLAIWHGW
jgi:hypothetical protein